MGGRVCVCGGGGVEGGQEKLGGYVRLIKLVIGV